MGTARAARRCNGKPDGAGRFGMDFIREASPLIAGRKIAGTAVYDAGGDEIGVIYDVVIDKRTGKLIYAVVSLGGFLGIGKRLYPLPWSALTYGSALGGYEVHLSKAELEEAPGFAPEQLPDFPDSDEEAKLHRYYHVEPYWTH
ncbi:MAG: PRC-barrel domain containing protein [Bradyrhizobium sp.]|nr:MAG: PRC-barrel domain containing protein [Bradyrhizobium sp.]